MDGEETPQEVLKGEAGVSVTLRFLGGTVGGVTRLRGIMEKGRTALDGTFLRRHCGRAL